MERIFDSYKNYVCPKCFHKLHECTCEYFPPYSLIFVDSGIQDVIRILNEKGYTTNGSCEGHYMSHCETPYISFIMEYEFDCIPSGFMYNAKRKMIVANIKEHDYDKYEKKRVALLCELKKWAEAQTKKEP